MRLSDSLHILHLPSWLNDGIDVLTASYIHTIDDFMELKNYCIKEGIKKLVEVPIAEEIIDKISHLAQISHETDSAEYIYNVDKLVSKKGSGYEDFRHKINRYEKLYPTSDFSHEANPPSKKVISEITNLYELWHDFTTESSKHASNEESALKRYIEVLDKNHSFMDRTEHFYLRYQNALVGFAVVEIIKEKYAVGHFLKINLNLSGASQYFIYKISQALASMCVETLNAQEDMGIEGLRNFKKHLNPEKMSQAYSLVFG